MAKQKTIRLAAVSPVSPPTSPPSDTMSIHLADLTMDAPLDRLRPSPSAVSSSTITNSTIYTTTTTISSSSPHSASLTPKPTTHAVPYPLVMNPASSPHKPKRHPVARPTHHSPLHYQPTTTSSAPTHQPHHHSHQRQPSPQQHQLQPPFSQYYQPSPYSHSHRSQPHPNPHLLPHPLPHAQPQDLKPRPTTRSRIRSAALSAANTPHEAAPHVPEIEPLRYATPEIRHQLYLSYEQVVNALRGKGEAYLKAAQRVERTHVELNKARSDLQKVEKTERQVQEQVRALEKNRLRRALLRGKTADDIARLTHRLSTISQEAMVAKARFERLERKAADYQVRAETLRADAELLATSERARQQILAEQHWHHAVQERQRRLERQHQSVRALHPAGDGAGSRSGSRRADSTRVRRTMRPERVHDPQFSPHSYLPPHLASVPFPGLPIPLSQQQQFSTSTDYNQRFVSDLQDYSSAENHRRRFNNGGDTEAEAFVDEVRTFTGGTRPSPLSGNTRERLARVSQQAQGSLSAQREARRLLLTANKLLTQVRGRLWDGFIASSRRRQAQHGGQSSHKQPPAQSNTGHVSFEFKWAVWQVREAGKRIERAIVLTDRTIPVRRLVDEWTSNGTPFLDLTDVLLDAGDNTSGSSDEDSEQRRVVDRAVRIVDNVIAELRDSVGMQDGVIADLVGRLHGQDDDDEDDAEDDDEAGSAVSAEHSSGDGDEGMYRDGSRVERNGENEGVEDEDTVAHRLSDVVRLRSDLGHQLHIS